MEETEQVSQGRQPSNPRHDLLEPGLLFAAIERMGGVYLDDVRWRVQLATIPGMAGLVPAKALFRSSSFRSKDVCE